MREAVPADLLQFHGATPRRCDQRPLKRGFHASAVHSAGSGWRRNRERPAVRGLSRHLVELREDASLEESGSRTRRYNR